METCVRGFSFMSDSKVEIIDLQYIEGGELERAWRSTRRERMKQREQKIWDEFVKEKDVVQGVCSDDPYQFLDQLPESCLKELMETELKKMTKENEEEARAKEKDLAQQGNGDTLHQDENQHTCVVTFADDMDKDDCDMFHIFDDDQSGGEDERLNESISPTTVREKSAEPQSLNVSPERSNSAGKISSKSSENVSNVIESSIYCAKVKDLRIKIVEELMSMMTTLDRRDILSAEPEDITRMIKRSAEFCSRFNRIYMYQLHRQLHDIKRHNSVTLPFAKHTQFQSQMVRIVSLHQNLLQSFQVFHKSFDSTCMVRESAVCVGALVCAARDTSAACADVPPPKDFAAALELYNDDVIPTCDKFDEFVSEYAIRCEEFLNNFENLNMAYSKKIVKNKPKKRSFGPWIRNNTRTVTETEARLSMYSLDTLRLHLNAKPSTSKDNQNCGTAKTRNSSNNASTSNVKRGETDKTLEPPKGQKRSPSARGRSRRPLMRDPHAGRPRAPRPTRDTDIRTMVEAVETCTSSHISREGSPHGMASTPRRAAHTPRSTNSVQHHTSRKNQPTSHSKLLNDVKIQAKPKPVTQSPKTTTLKPTLSSIKSDHETVDCTQVTPVCKIQCAMKKELDAESERASKFAECSKVVENSPRKPSTPRKSEVPPKKLSSPKKPSFSPPGLREDTTEKKERERTKTSSMAPDRVEVTRLLKQLCSGDSGTERVSGAKNAQLLQYVSGSSPRQPSTPQLLRILEETIKKKVPKALYHKPNSARKVDRYRLTFNIADKTAEALFQYRTKFIQHMLTSALYANSAVGKPWEMIGSISEQIIDELLLGCVKEMELREMMQEIYKRETC